MTAVKKNGVKIHIAADILGFPYVFGITTANVSDRDGLTEMYLLDLISVPVYL